MTESDPKPWRPTLEIQLGHGLVLSDGERLHLTLNDAAFRYEALQTLAEHEVLLFQLDVLSASAPAARWLDLDAACEAWGRGRLGAGKLGLSAAEEAARRALPGGPPVQSRVPDAFVPAHRVDLYDERGGRVAEVFCDGTGGFWRAMDPSPALVRQLIELFARPQSYLGGGADLGGGMCADFMVDLLPWRFATIEYLLGAETWRITPRQRLADRPGPIRSGVVTPPLPQGKAPGFSADS